jgi:hypothetical protein
VKVTKIFSPPLASDFRLPLSPCPSLALETLFYQLERVKGIEPLSKAWEALVLPLNYTRASGLRRPETQFAFFLQVVNAYPRQPQPAKGISFDASRVTTKPTAETMVSITLKDFSVSFSVRPLNRDTTQKPLSFIQDEEKAAKPIDK